MAGITRPGGLGAGAAGVAVLLLLVFALDAPLWVAVPLAVATYAGVALVRRERSDRAAAGGDDRRSPIAIMMNHVAALRRLEARVAKPEVRGQVGRIAAGSERVAQAICEDEDQAAARLFAEQVLAPVVALLTEYVRLTTRGVASAAGVVERTEARDLPLVEQAIDDIYERLHRSSLAELATTAELLELNLGHVASAIARRGRS